MKAYKLTDQNGQTKNNTQWGENITHTVTGTNPELCSSSWLHFYTDPLIAVLLNRIHADFKEPILWECEAAGEILEEPLKAGCKRLTTIKQIPLPQITPVQRQAFAILCAKQVYEEPKWLKWADNWLSNTDRTKKSAYAAAYAAYAADAAVDAAYAAAYAAYAADAAAAADAAVDAAAAADAAAYAAAKIDFASLAKEAMNYS